MHGLARALASGHPYDLLVQTSVLIEVFRRNASAPHGAAHASAADVVNALVGARRPETTAVLTVLAQLLNDELLLARIRNEVSTRPDHLPAWLRRLGDFKVPTVWEMVDPLGDGDNHILGVEFGSGHHMTAVVYVDHNMGTIVKDAFLIPSAADDVVRRFRELADGDVLIDPMDSAAAGSRIAEAIAAWDRRKPHVETETWPGCRAAVEWIVGALPPGGRGYERKAWTNRERRELAVAFFASDFGAPFAARRGNHDLVDYLISFASDVGAGDPLRWSPVAVEIVLCSPAPPMVLLDLDDLERLPELLKAFIRFAHHERAVSAQGTRDTLTAIDHWQPDYDELIHSAETQAIHDLAREAAGGLFDSRSYEEIVLDELAEEVGGPDALARLDSEPLPDEPMQWEWVADDIRERLATVVDLADRCCRERLDTEYRTCCRRLLTRAAHRDPDVFRRRGRDDMTAAATVWAAGKINGLFAYNGMTVKDLLAWFGIKQSSVSQKARTIAAAAGLPSRSTHAYTLVAGDAALLHSQHRAAIIARRDRILAG